jgi:hypothetical protein
MLQVYVLNVLSIFIRMLHSNVSCCTCFVLFGKSTGVGSGGTAWAPEMGRGELEAGGRGATGVGCACGMRPVASNPGGKGMLRGRGESSGRVGAATGRVCMWGGNKNQHQRTGSGCAGILFGRLGASIAR